MDLTRNSSPPDFLRHVMSRVLPFTEVSGDLEKWPAISQLKGGLNFSCFTDGARLQTYQISGPCGIQTIHCENLNLREQESNPILLVAAYLLLVSATCMHGQFLLDRLSPLACPLPHRALYHPAHAAMHCWNTTSLGQTLLGTHMEAQQTFPAAMDDVTTASTGCSGEGRSQST